MTRERLFQVRPCVVCHEETTREVVELTYDYGNFRIVVKGVPAAVCRSCDERFVPGEFGVWLGDEIADLAARVESFLATEDAFADFQVSARVDGGRLVSSGRIAASALSGL